jgi:heme/copper-type cytochrome/quinol oxidase subunit 2
MQGVVLAMWTLAAVGTFVAMFCCIWDYRRTTDCAAHFHRSAVVEMVWTAVPCVMLITGAIPAARLIWSNASLSSAVANTPARYLLCQCDPHETQVEYPSPAQCPSSEFAPAPSSIATNLGYRYRQTTKP